MKDGQVNVEFADGRRIVVRNDSTDNYGFVLGYLKRMSVNYRAHLMAMDLILQSDLGFEYKKVKEDPELYHTHLAVQSMNCVFGRCDEIPDCDREGEFNMEFTVCPRRAVCPYNGYNEKYRSKLIVGCNPVYECGLTAHQAQVTDLLVNTSMRESDIAEAMGNTPSTIKKVRQMIFNTIGVSSRPELVQKLKGKRLL